jgi:tetratricopeptide (TPR) repeat protein
MPGKVLAEAFDPALAGQINRAPVPTLQRQRAAPAAAVDDAIAQDAMKKLEALGYISRDTHDQHNNLGQRYQKQRQYEKAIAEFEQALAHRAESARRARQSGSVLSVAQRSIQKLCRRSTKRWRSNPTTSTR